MRRKEIGIIVFVALLMFFASWLIYGNQSTKADYTDKIEYVIGVSQANMRESWRLALISEIQEEAEKYDNIRIITTDATSDVEKQEKDVDRLLNYGIDLLIISPCDSKRMTEKVKEVYQHEIPVIVMDRAVEGFDYSLFIGPDNHLIGEQGGECVKQLLSEQGGNVLELCSAPDSIQSKERSEGFQEALADAAQITRTTVNLEDSMKDSAYDLILSMKIDLRLIDVIFANNDAVAFGAYEALRSMGMEEQIPIVGCDGFTGMDEGIDLVQKGKLAATITCPTGGKEAIQYAINILNQDSGVPKQVILRSHTITKDNADEYLASLSQEYVDDGEEIVMGFAQVGQESAFRLANTQSILEAAKEFNVKLYLEDANQSQEKQIEAVRKFIEMKVDVIVISPVVETGWDEVLMEAKEAGIPVVMSDREIDTEADLVATYIGADFQEEGRRAMRWLRDNVPANGKEMKIMELKGNKGASPTVGRKEGFEEVLKENPEYRIVHSDYGDFTKEGGKRIVEEYLAEHGDWDIDIIFSHNDDMALGAIEALQDHGINPGVDVKIVSVDATKEAFEAMIDGTLNCAVECNPLLGAPLMKAVRDMMSGKEMPLRIITEEKVYDQTTAEQVIDERAY